MGRSKESDEVFCRSCGERIKEAAELCPYCGVRNTERTPRKPQLRTPYSHDPARYDTIVSGNWWWVIVVGMALQLFTEVYNGDVLPMDILFTTAWVLPPLGLYVDAKYVRANSYWDPSGGWVVGGLLPPISLIAGTVYLYQRHTVLDIP